jgi:mono/diheme cytochrome c family protein
MGPAELLEQLRSPERWTRYQAKRVLFDRPRASVVRAADSWVNRLLQEPGETEKALLETLGVFEAHEAPRPALLRHLLNSKDARVRAYATRVLGAWGNRIPESCDWLQERAGDTHPRVRLEAVVAASYLQSPESIAIVMKAWKSQRDPFLDYAIHQSARSLQSTWAPLLASGRLAFGGDLEPVGYLKGLVNKPFTPPSRGQALYEMACLPCHQPNGKGLPGVYPPLSGSEWVRGEPGNLIRILLNGLGGEIQVAGQTFGGGNSLTMPALGGLTDEQLADVLS